MNVHDKSLNLNKGNLVAPISSRVHLYNNYILTPQYVVLVYSIEVISIQSQYRVQQTLGYSSGLVI